MSKINVRNFSNENNDGAPDIVGVSTFSATSFFVPTRGTTAQRPSDHVEVGSLRYNYDIKNLEYYRGHGLGWSQFELIDPDLGGGTGSNTGLGTRALSMGGQAPGDINIVESVTISTLGNTQDFGDISVTRTQSAGLASRIRAFCVGGQVSPSTYKNEIDSHEFSSTGDFIDYGDLTGTARLLAAFASSTRGVAAGGQPRNDVIDYFTMATTGTAKDFGDLPAADSFGSGLASSTRGLVKDGSVNDNTISYVTISSTGDALNYGDLTVTRGTHVQTASNSTRGIFAGGQTPTAVTTIEFVTIATLGNSSSFGDLTRSTVETNAGASDPTRAIFMGNGPSVGDTIDHIQILTTGNAVDFGNLSANRTHNCGCSNGHGGL